VSNLRKEENREENMNWEKARVWKAISILSFVLIMNCRVAETKPLIQVAILLDTSGSMSGLINQARAHLWKIVNEFATVKKMSEKPEFQVALFEYGNNGLTRENGYIRLIVPFTTDLDRVSEELFSLTTNGGDEYCGQVIGEAAEKLEWSKSNADYKAIFIAGNEPFTQGAVDYRKTCKGAIKKGIIINTIHCGNYETGVNSGWKDGADIADGTYASIDHNKTIPYIEAPQDKEIAALGLELNKTYLAYGTEGKEGKNRQEAQEENASEISKESFISRQVAKASVHYKNTRWDLVDAVRENTVKLDNLTKDELPEEMKNMNEKEREEYVKKMSQAREEIKKKINSLNLERQKYIAEKTKELYGGADTLDSALIKAIRKQTEKKQFLSN
jgi:hypothetical protein